MLISLLAIIALVLAWHGLEVRWQRQAMDRAAAAIRFQAQVIREVDAGIHHRPWEGC